MSINYLLTFFSTHTALKAEKLLKEEDIDFKLLPTPGELVSGCGLSIGFYRDEKEKILDVLDKGKIRYRCYVKSGRGYKRINPY